MIPPSYLFKDIYHQHWEEPTAPTVFEQKHRFMVGLMNPLAAPVIALFAIRERRDARKLGSHAYD